MSIAIARDRLSAAAAVHSEAIERLKSIQRHQAELARRADECRRHIARIDAEHAAALRSAVQTGGKLPQKPSVTQWERDCATATDGAALLEPDILAATAAIAEAKTKVDECRFGVALEVGKVAAAELQAVVPRINEVLEARRFMYGGADPAKTLAAIFSYDGATQQFISRESVEI